MDSTVSTNQTAPTAIGRRWAWWAMLALCLAGLVLSAMLAQIHFKANTQPDFHSFCGRGTTFNCDSVARTAYSVLLGVPTAWWGLFGYLVAAGLVLAGLRNRESKAPVGFGLLLFTAFALFSGSLAVISALKIHSLCILCASTYGINLLLFIIAVLQASTIGLSEALAAPWQSLRERPGKVLAILIALAAVAGGLMAFTPTYWRLGSHEQKWMELEGLNRGITPDGGQFIGAEKPVITVTEFSDYQCPGCKAAHAELRNIVKRYPDQVRVVHRHFPLDQSCNRSIDRPFHSDACRAATIATCAGRGGRFWEANDFLFGHSLELESLSNKAIASDLGVDPAALETCMQGEGLAAVKNDIETGIALNLRGTPSFLVDGQLYFGNLPASALEKLQPEQKKTD
jgi:protein-disulfide isomerase/uncharacterized membrane protein